MILTSFSRRKLHMYSLCTRNSDCMQQRNERTTLLTQHSKIERSTNCRPDRTRRLTSRYRTNLLQGSRRLTKEIVCKLHNFLKFTKGWSVSHKAFSKLNGWCWLVDVFVVVRPAAVARIFILIWCYCLSTIIIPINPSLLFFSSISSSRKSSHGFAWVRCWLDDVTVRSTVHVRWWYKASKIPWIQQLRWRRLISHVIRLQIVYRKLHKLKILISVPRYSVSKHCDIKNACKIYTLPTDVNSVIKQNIANIMLFSDIYFNRF